MSDEAMNSSTEPWTFTGTEMSNMFLWGMLAGAVCSAPTWISLGINLVRLANHG